MSAIAVSEEKPPLTIITCIMGSHRRDILAVRLAGCDHLERLIQLSQWLQTKATEIGQWPDGTGISMLTAVANIPQACVWRLDGFDSDDWPEDGIVAAIPPRPPDDPADYWPTPLFRVRDDGMLDIEGDGAEWGQVDLYLVRSQLQ